MSRFLIITHAYDDFFRMSYLLEIFAGQWAAAGHHVTVAQGLGDWPEADAAILHVDLSVVPTAYVEAARRYPVVVNGAATDIRKRQVSRHLVRPDDGWTGPVIVKTDLNCGGIPEQTKLARGGASDLSAGTIVSTTAPYPILPSAAEVPDAVWHHPGLVVERFLPEQDSRGFWARTWIFFGDRERCSRYLCDHPIVKGRAILAREPAEVPDLLRAERERLGFDYGKFDFVLHDGEPILFDANRTPGAPPALPELAASNLELARGIDMLMRRAA
jgi:hypothetical protein